MRYLLTAILVSVCAPVLGQATRPAADVTAGTQPAIDPLSARVIQLTGNASYALSDGSGAAGEWKPAKVGDVLPAGTRVRTQLRTQLILAFGDDTVVVVERATLASIDQFHRAADTKRVKLGLGYGTVRAGVSETTLRSDMTIETPTATLSKRGTMEFGISYEPSTGRFRVFLNKEGLIEAREKLRGDAQILEPGQYVTQNMMAWIDTLSGARWVAVIDTNGLTGSEKLFNRLNQSGIAVLDPGAGGNLMTMSSRDNGSLAGQNLQNAAMLPLVPLVTPGTPGPGGLIQLPRPEGNFGTGTSGAASSLLRTR